jgi:RNA polymerase sigma-70 factor (ECF subfamily)
LDGERLASDSTLVVAVARRHEAALAELYRRHAGSLLCAALRVVSTRPLAEELVQDLFGQLWRFPDRFQPEQGSLRAFLLAQCHRSAVDIVRSVDTRLSHGGRNLHAVEGAFVSEDQLLDFVAGHKLRAAVATLREAEREAISLTYFGGQSCKAVAVLLDVPEETIRSRIRSGLSRLRAALLEAGIDPLVTNTLVS